MKTKTKHLFTIVVAASAYAACYSGKSDVPQISASASSTGGAGGDAATTSTGGASSTSATTTTATNAASTGAGAATSTTTGTGGSAPDPCATALFCDDFESYAEGAPPTGKWNNNQSSGTIAIATDQAHSGTKAVKIQADATADYRSVMISLNDASIFPVANDHFFGRMMFYLASAPATSVHWTFIDASGPISGQGYDAIYRYGGQQPVTDGSGNFVGSQFMANYETPDVYQTPPVGPGSDCYMAADNVVAPVGVWSCAEWEFDGSSNTMRFWLDGNSVDSLTMMTTGDGCANSSNQTMVWQAPDFAQVDLGFESYQMDDARTIWIDDVGISTTRLGCPQ